MSALFVTATGTDIGKTFVAAGLIRHLRHTGGRVDAIKPVLSGYDPLRAADSDAGVLLAALGRTITDDTIAEISPWRFTAPLSPDLAAARERRSVDMTALVDFCRRKIAATDGTLLIEGVGGVMVPLDTERTVLDWMTMLNIPLLLVTGSYLGTISHTLTALEVLKASGLDVAAIVISESENSSVPLGDTADTIRRFAGGIDVVTLRRQAEDTQSAFEEIAAAAFR